TVTDRCTEACIGAGNETAEAPHHVRVDVVAKPFYRHDVDGGPPLGAERVQRDAIAEVVERHGQRSRRGSLMLVYRGAGRARSPGRTRDVEQDEHGEVAPVALAFDVHRVVGWRAGEGFDTRFDDCIDVDVIALQLPATALELHAEAGERPTQGLGRRRYEGRHVLWPRYGPDR